MAKESLFKIINDRQSVTDSIEFGIHPGDRSPFLFQVNAGVPIIDALNVAEDLQRAAAILLSRVANEHGGVEPELFPIFLQLLRGGVIAEHGHRGIAGSKIHHKKYKERNPDHDGDQHYQTLENITNHF